GGEGYLDVLSRARHRYGPIKGLICKKAERTNAGRGRAVTDISHATDFLKLLTYLAFFFIVLTFYGLPLHIIRDVYITLRSFISRIRDFIRYRRATNDMNARYPDATEEEVERENVCIICREEMRPYIAAQEGAGPQ